MAIEPIDINTYQGEIPKGKDLVVYSESNPEECYVLYGWDEVGPTFCINDPQYGFRNNHE